MTAGRRDTLIGLALALLTVVGLAVGHRSVGYVRDEGIYFEAGRSYAAWFGDLAEEPGRALSKRGRDRRFRTNHEHPALMKIAFGLGARALAEPVQTSKGPKPMGAVAAMPEGAAMRLPAQVLAGFGVFLLFWAGRTLAGLAGGVLSAGAFILLPRVAFHAGLAAFDVPVAVAIFGLVLAYRRALRDPRWGLALGPILGLCIAIKHNALFAPILFGLHYLICLGVAWRRDGRRPGLAQLAPLPFVSMAVLAPLVAGALWPWMWTDTVARIGEYFAFHREHAYYNMEYLGVNHNTPPMPWSYPFVMLWATVPTGLLLLGGVGLIRGLLDDRRQPSQQDLDGDVPRPSWTRPLPDPLPRLDGTLGLLFTAFPLLLIAWPTTPIFGGTKHFITAYPFLAVAAARGFAAAWDGAWLPHRILRVPALAVTLVLVPTAMGTLSGHPHNLSQYAPLAGGARGAAALGLNRGFWGHSVVPLLPSLDELPPRGKIYVHDVHSLAVEQYKREGRWPIGLQSVPVRRANSGLLFHEKHMTTYEAQLWDRMATPAPAMVVHLHDVPLTSFYLRNRKGDD